MRGQKAKKVFVRGPGAFAFTEVSCPEPVSEPVDDPMDSETCENTEVSTGCDNTNISIYTHNAKFFENQYLLYLCHIDFVLSV